VSEMKFGVTKYREGITERGEDEVASEEPLRLTVTHGEESKSVYIMRTPVDDIFLVVGFLYTQGVISGKDDIERLYVKEDQAEVVVKRSFQLRDALVNSSCGLCGGPIPEVLVHPSSLRVEAKVLLSLPRKMRENQRGFLETGGLHAAAVFDARGDLLFVEEDVGRHNAVDKVIGRMILSDVEAGNLILQVSGRAGYEIAEKGVTAGFPVISAISAPTTSAVRLCQITGTSLVAFVREDRMNIYSHPERIVTE